MPSRARQSRHISLSTAKGFLRHRCEIVAVGYGCESDPRRYVYLNAHRSRFSLFQYTLAGEGRFREKPGGPEILMTSPRAFLVNCPSPTSYWVPPGKTWEFFYVLFVGEMAAWHVDQLVNHHTHTFDLPPDSPPADLLRRTYQEAAAHLPLDKFTLSSRLYQMLMELYRVEKSSPPAAEGVARAVQWIDQNYADSSLRVEEMARQAGLSPFHFSRVFRRQTGLSPYGYLTQVRMDHALNLLKQTPCPIKQIASLVGFNDDSYFCRTFRQHHRRSPGSFRRPA